MDTPEKLATQGTQDEKKQKKNTTQDVLDTTILRLSILHLGRKSKILAN